MKHRPLYSTRDIPLFPVLRPITTYIIFCHEPVSTEIDEGYHARQVHALLLFTNSLTRHMNTRLDSVPFCKPVEGRKTQLARKRVSLRARDVAVADHAPVYSHLQCVYSFRQSYCSPPHHDSPGQARPLNFGYVALT
jgi:hypothetical protein